jgi:hypothetical protein
LGFVGTFNDHQFEIGDLLQYNRPASIFNCLCVIVAFVFENQKWNFVLVVDPTPSGNTNNGWRSRLCLTPSTTVTNNLKIGSMILNKFQDIPPKTQKLSNEVIEHTRHLVGNHADKGGIITSDIVSIARFRENELQLTKDESSTFTKKGIPKCPESPSPETFILMKPGRLFIDIDKYVTHQLWHFSHYAL